MKTPSGKRKLQPSNLYGKSIICVNERYFECEIVAVDAHNEEIQLYIHTLMTHEFYQFIDSFKIEKQFDRNIIHYSFR